MLNEWQEPTPLPRAFNQVHGKPSALRSSPHTEESLRLTIGRNDHELSWHLIRGKWHPIEEVRGCLDHIPAGRTYTHFNQPIETPPHLQRCTNVVW